MKITLENVRKWFKEEESTTNNQDLVINLYQRLLVELSKLVISYPFLAYSDEILKKVTTRRQWSDCATLNFTASGFVDLSRSLFETLVHEIIH